MKKKTIITIICGIILLIVGFIAGQEYTKYQIRKTMAEAFSGIENVFNDNQEEVADINDDTTPKTIKDKEEKVDKEEKSKKDVVANLKKGETKVFTGKYDGDNIEAEISLWDVAFIDEILPPEPRKSFYTYFPKQDNKTFAVLYMNVKNIGGKNFDLSDVIRNSYNSKCSSKAIFGGKYEYTADIIAELEKDNKGSYTYDSTFIYVDPLESKEFIVAFSLPTEVKDKEAELNLCLGNQKIAIDLSEPEPQIEVSDNETVTGEILE